MLCALAALYGRHDRLQTGYIESHRVPETIWYSSHLSARQTTAHKATGYSDYQVYLMLSCAPIQGHVGGLVDVSPSPFLQTPFIHLFHLSVTRQSPSLRFLTNKRYLSFSLDPKRMHDLGLADGYFRL